MYETFYKKNEQGEFDPLGVGIRIEIFKQGATLVVVDGNWRSHAYNVRPDHAAVLASLKLFKQELIKQVAREQLQAWEELKKVLDDTTLAHPIAADIVDRALEGFEEKTADLLKDPAIRKAYERLETLIELKGKHHEVSNSC